MLSILKDSFSAMRRMLSRRLSTALWVMCLLVLFTISHLALLHLQRNSDLKAIDSYKNSTLDILFRRLVATDKESSAATGTAGVVVNLLEEEVEELEEEVPRASGPTEVDKPSAASPVEGAAEDEILLPERDEVIHPEQYQKDSVKRLSSHWNEEKSKAEEELFHKRSEAIREICQGMKLTGALSPKMHQVYQNMRYITKHNMIWCPVFKAASTTWVKNLLMIAGENKVTEKSLHARVRQIYSQPEDPRIRDKLISESEKMLIVRHPLDRLLSAYRDKMLRVRNSHDPHVRLQQEIMHRFPDPNAPPVPSSTTPSKKKTKKKKKMEEEEEEEEEETPMRHPTFTQFLMKVREDLQKAWRSEGKFLVNMHWRPVWLTCAPCQVSYDYIAKVETLDLDQEYIIRKMGLQDLLYNAQTHSSNFDSYNTTKEAANDYFRQVPRRLLRDVVELYQPDFTLFDYSPDAHLELAKPEE